MNRQKSDCVTDTVRWRHLVSWRCSTSTTPSPTVTPSTPCMNTCTRARCLRKPRMLASLTGNYMPYERLVFRSMRDKGVTRAQIRAVVESIPSVPGLEDVLRFLENSGAEVIFISDANSVFIQDWLDAHKLSHTVRRIFTNPAHYDKDGCLQVEDYHVQDTCQLSTHNLCKGRILEDLRQMSNLSPTEGRKSSIGIGCGLYMCQPEPFQSPFVTPENQHERLADVVTPLWRLPYEEQLQHKYKWALSVVKQFTTKLHLSARKSRPTSRRPNYFIPVNQVKASPLTEEYRNKDEFNIRTGVDGNPKTVGFFIGSPAKGSTVCVRGTNLINLKQSHKQAAQAYEDYIRISDLPACHDLYDGGHWRSFIVRSTSSGKLMATTVFHPQNMEHAAVEEEALKLREYFVHGAGAHINLSSLYFQAW
uniref:Uncharacterized protein n=1 Tax=Timema genevievae TaxID=629358 RepID=A0A7R9JNU0_TIMGE|nr:unnamed protein product [Timema genevievae]